MASSLHQFKTLLDGSEFLFVVYFRGHWCPFCMSYLKSLQALTSEIIAANGKPLIITAESEEHMAATREATGYQGDAIVDTQNLLPKEMGKRGFVNVAISDKSGYPHGMAQPAILVIKNDRTVLYEWAIKPSVMNLGGAKDRPSLQQVWEDIDAKLKGKPPVHRSYAKTSLGGMLKEKIFG